VAPKVSDHYPYDLVNPIVITDESQSYPDVSIRPRIPHSRKRLSVQKDVEIVDLAIVLNSNGVKCGIVQ
jgi:hypothetical protein